MFVSTQEIVQPKNLVKDLEDLRLEMPIDAFLEESREVENIMAELDKAYEKREKVIDQILKEGTGFESRKALRMFPTSMLEKWLEELISSKPKR
jgi:nucleoid-associated protein YejK